ncbi:OprD family porin [Stutzerimonas zhaodongensis]|uniref:OprD family porin n=2 Tax=Stutzerimonas zhaodongensis TaxID=1176257 RepID=A0A3M2HP67_9GAMM|nr:OprD family porin [Stutzerimonas zhaodongensis]MCQ2029531.1 OprD family porin [Stutzerimonas zhaodongensis]MCQ4316249.1 OprD family porin [Stutzerimonas zhaodongensis]RMH89703.1 OprD family porin [Stutzerimonas zhaodongensis]
MKHHPAQANRILAPTMLAVSIAAVVPLAASAEGFVEDTKITVNARNFYIGREFRDDAVDRTKAEEWTQSFILNIQSGYTPGPVGFGVDVLAGLAVKLDGGRGTYGTALLPRHRDGRPADDYGRFGVAAKAKVSNTELKIGEMMPVLPILRSDDGRSLPQTFEGGMVTSREIDGLMLTAGQFRQNSPRDDASMEDMTFGGGASDRFNFVGGEYAFNEKRTTLGLWAAELKDVYEQRYVQLLHTQPLGDDLALTANLGYFQGDEDGSARAGKLDNKTYSGLFGLKTGGNTFYVGLQRVSGDTWMRVNGTSGGTLANDSFNNSYDNAEERSWQVRHDYNFAAVGVPGLTLMNRYISGDNIRTATTDDGKEWGRETELAYTIQNGPAKNLNIKWRNSSFRSQVNTRDLDENRLIFNYPLSIL